MVENERLVKARKNNMKLFPIYRMVGVDSVFLYAIKMLFLTQVNNINASDVVFSVSMYALFMIFLQIPATILIDKIGYKKSAFISNVFNIIYISILIFSKNVIHLIIAEFASAITFSLKDVSEPSLLNASIPKTNKKGKIYSKIDGKGHSRYNYLNATSNIIAGSIYVINPYLPMIFAIVFSAIACILSLQFTEIDEDVDNKNENKLENNVKEYIDDLKNSFKFIFKSKRLRSLLIYSGAMWGICCLIVEYKDTILIEIGTPSIMIGIVGAILGIASGIGSKKQVEFHSRFRNKSLTYIALNITICAIIAGIITIINAPFVIELIIITLSFIMIKMDNAMVLVLINRYLGNFANQKILSKIYSANAIIKNLQRMIIGVLGSILMARIDTNYALVITGIISLLLMIVILIYMSTRVGLKPEEYKEEEILL